METTPAMPTTSHSPVDLTFKSTFLHYERDDALKRSLLRRRSRSMPALRLERQSATLQWTPPSRGALLSGAQSSKGIQWNGSLTLKSSSESDEHSTMIRPVTPVASDSTSDSSTSDEHSTMALYSDTGSNPSNDSSQDQDQEAESSILGGRVQCLAVMIKNIPCACSQPEVLGAIASLGFGNAWDSFYMPSRRKAKNLGYAFVVFPDTDMARQFAQAMAGFCFLQHMSRNRIPVTIAPAQYQGDLHNMLKNPRAKRRVITNPRRVRPSWAQ